MGTRADFYIGRGEKAEWIASIAWDGYPDGERVAEVLGAKSESTFNKRVAELERGHDDFTGQAEGWPWPWETSATTDFAYAWDDGKVYVSMFGSRWLTPIEVSKLYAAEDVDWPKTPAAVFPNMKTDKTAAPGSKRSGILLIGPK